MLGQAPKGIGPDTPCPTCRILDGGPFQDSQYPYPECPCPEGFEKQAVEIKDETGAVVIRYRFCKPINGSCMGRKADVVTSPDQPPMVDETKKESGPNWVLILGGIGVAGLLYHRYTSLR